MTTNIYTTEKYLSFNGYPNDALDLIAELRNVYGSSDMPKILNDFIFNLEMALEKANVYNGDVCADWWTKITL